MLRISLDSLEDGMVLGRGIYSEEGKLLLGRGVALDSFFIGRLRKLGMHSVFVRDEDTDDVIPPENIPDMVRGATLRHLRQLFGSFEEIAREIRTFSVSAIRDTVSSEKFQGIFRDHPAVRKIFKDIEHIVGCLLGGEVTLGLNSLKTHDNYTFQHSIDVTVVSILIGRRIGLPAKRLQELGVGCLLHDIGKTFIPLEILNKPGKLTEDEFSRMKLHPHIGFEIVRGVESIGILPPHVVFQHHERQDGSGYPRGLTGNNRLDISDEPRTIHLYAGIAAVADVFDALSSDRPYRKALPPEEVVGVLRAKAGAELNREVVRTFLDVVPIYPVGNTVRIVRGKNLYHIGVVVRTNPDRLDRPVIRVLIDQNRRRIAPIEIDLAVEDDIEIASILL